MDVEARAFLGGEVGVFDGGVEDEGVFAVEDFVDVMGGVAEGGVEVVDFLQDGFGDESEGFEGCVEDVARCTEGVVVGDG